MSALGRAAKPAGAGRAVGGGDPNAPKPSSTRLGGSASRAPGLAVVSLPATVPDRLTIRLSISTKLPEIGRSDQPGTAGTTGRTEPPPPPPAAPASIVSTAPRA